MELIVHLTYHKERVSIAKKANPLNPVQWNVLAIIFILGFMPFAVAFISNAGSSSDTSYESTMRETPGIIGENLIDSYWIENGGTNYTQWYIDQGLVVTNYAKDCTYVKNGFCEGYYTDSPTQPEETMDLGPSYFGYNFDIPVRSSTVYQSHYYGSGGNGYSGSSGDDEFSWHFGSQFFEDIEQGQSIDGLKMWLLDEDYFSCSNYQGFANITFEGEIKIHYKNSTRTFSNFNFDKNTKFEFSSYDFQSGSYSLVCGLGFTLEFDFTGFETLTIDQFNYGDWDNTTVSVYLTNFVNKDQENFGGTQLPFAGDDRWNVGFEYKSINPEEAGFLIKTGTLLLAVITLGVALASTPYWDPFRNFFKGMVE